jgi:hypothetical protein
LENNYILVVQVRAVKIYAAATVEALRKEEKRQGQDESSVYHQNCWKKLVWVPAI